MNDKKKVFLTIFISTLLSIFIFYFLFFLKVSFEQHHKSPYLFKSIETLQFHKKYSRQIHHLRDSNGNWEIEDNYENYLFSTINQFSMNNQNILIQGDSWMEQLNLERKSYDLISNFAKKNNLGLINAGVTSFSPSLMKLQYEILETDFNFKPNIVVAYIDQTDIGDELCRYKDQSVYDNNNNLVAVKNERYSRATYDYTKIYNISEIVLLNKSQLKRNFKFTNFFISYGPQRLIKKIKSIKKYGWKNKDKSKCQLSVILEYLIGSNKEEIYYFENKVKNYINLLISKEYIDKIIIVTFPHRNNIFKHDNSGNEKKLYSINVSNIIEKIVKNEGKIYHLNFTKLILDGILNLEKDSFKKNDPASHLTEEAHANIFTKSIINLLNNY